MKFYNYDIVFQEIPDETALAINLTNCPNHCEGCHSPHLWKDIGQELTEDILRNLLNRYRQMITCVCLMGGDGQRNEVENFAKYIRENTSLKMAWYSGREQLPSNLEFFDYVKLGRYVPACGGLKSRTTNQRLFKIEEKKIEDITARFWK